MNPDLLLLAGLGIAPVALLLAALLALDSYKLVHLRAVLAVLVAGASLAVLCLPLHRELATWIGLPMSGYARTVGPMVEELAKALVIAWLARTHGIGFLVDAAIYGFAVGTGFAVVENVVYAQLNPGAGFAVWLVRGGGTALMHGGATALVALAVAGAVDRGGRRRPTALAWVVGLALGIGLHVAYNQFFVSPTLATAGMLVALPVALTSAFRVGERSYRRWLDVGFDSETEMLDLILAGRVSGSPVGSFLEAIREHFSGEIVVDMLNYLRTHLELSLAVKGILMMREAGFASDPDPAVQEKLDELAFLERSIGPTGRRVMAPFVAGGDRQRWQRQLLQR